jgi:hypothetical protein
VGLALCGLNVGLIKEVISVKALIDGIINEARTIGERLNSMGVFAQNVEL